MNCVDICRLVLLSNVPVGVANPDRRSTSRASEKVDDRLKRCKDNGVNRAGLIAFRWAWLPAEQTCQPDGDWNQGMLSMGLAENIRFDLTVRWVVEGINHQATLTGVGCAK